MGASVEIPKWQIVENVVAALQRARGSTSGWRVDQNAWVKQKTSQKRRQVDVYITCPSAPWEFRVAIDVKNEKQPLDIELVEQLCAKGAKLNVDKYMIVSTSGYTNEAYVEAERNGVLALKLTEGGLSGPLRFFELAILRREISGVALEYHPNEEHPVGPSTDEWLLGRFECIRLREFAQRTVGLVEQSTDSPPASGEVTTLALNCRKPWTGLLVSGVHLPAPEWMLVECRYEGGQIVDASCRLGLPGNEPHPSELSLDSAYLANAEGYCKFSEFFQIILEEADKRLRKAEGSEFFRFLVFNWSGLRADGKDWKAPVAIEVAWRLVSESPEARRFKADEGHELVTAIVSMQPGTTQQLSFIATQDELGGNSLSLSFGPARPQRIDV